MNAGDLFVSLVVGLAVPLAIADGMRAAGQYNMPVQDDRLQFERRILPWFLALVAGPGLLIERLADQWRRNAIGRSDLLWGAFIALGWSGIYGFIFLRAVQFLVDRTA